LLEQCAQPSAHDALSNVHSPEAPQETLPLTCGSALQSWAQAPQW
jgi:hypothetical protein